MVFMAEKRTKYHSDYDPNKFSFLHIRDIIALHKSVSNTMIIVLITNVAFTFALFQCQRSCQGEIQSYNSLDVYKLYRSNSDL